MAVALDDSDIGVMQQPVEQGHNAGRIGEDLVPFFERPIGGEDDRLAFVSAVDDLIQQIGGFVAEGNVANFVDSQQSGIGVFAQLVPAAFRGLPMHLFEQGGSVAK